MSVSSLPLGPDDLTTHKATYSTLSPLRPELNQSGKNILITGASAGIGFAIARAYAEASASIIILTGRPQDVLQQAASTLSSEFSNTRFIVRVCGVGNVADSAALWTGLRCDGIFVDVLVLNAARFHEQKGVLETQLDATWSIKTTDHLLQAIADEVDRAELQIVSFHLGQTFSEAVRSAGLEENILPFDDENLPGHWAAWAATSEAAFLHGRFAWAAWDVDEMRSASFLSFSYVGI
ncbi:hypothetical protein BDV06DRAFT_213466 [Aspergillus oleicola]